MPQEEKKSKGNNQMMSMLPMLMMNMFGGGQMFWQGNQASGSGQSGRPNMFSMLQNMGSLMPGGGGQQNNMQSMMQAMQNMGGMNGNGMQGNNMMNMLSLLSGMGNKNMPNMQNMMNMFGNMQQGNAVNVTPKNEQDDNDRRKDSEKVNSETQRTGSNMDVRRMRHQEPDNSRMSEPRLPGRVQDILTFSQRKALMRMLDRTTYR